MNTEPLSQKLESLRNEISKIRSQLSDIRRSKCAFHDHMPPVEGLLTCGLISLNSIRKEVIEFEIKQRDHERRPSLHFAPRGIGLDSLDHCFCCEATERLPGSGTYLNNISGFVSTREEGAKITSWFDDKVARLDFRPHEPQWIQVKIGACDSHLPNLKHLQSLTTLYCRISERDIADARAFKAPVTPETAPDA